MGFNWFLIIIIIVVVVLVVLSSIYILINFQHPEDNNVAWPPKIVVVFGLTMAICTVLLFPLDVANQSACKSGVSLSACTCAPGCCSACYAALAGHGSKASGMLIDLATGCQQHMVLQRCSLG